MLPLRNTHAFMNMMIIECPEKHRKYNPGLLKRVREEELVGS